MSVRVRTSIELPRALSGSNELREWPCVASTRTVAGWTTDLSALTWADAVPICATREKMEIAVAAPLSNTRAELRFSTLVFPHFNAPAILPPLRLRPCFRHSIQNGVSCVKDFHCVKGPRALPDSAYRRE